MIRKFMIASMIWFLSALHAFATQPCEVFYRTALYDEIHSKVKKESKYLSVKKFCSAYENSKSSASGAGFEFVVNNVPMGGSLSNEERNTVASNICNSDLTDNIDNVDVDVLSKVVSPVGAEIVKECLKADAYGLKVEKLSFDLSGSNSLSISISWNPLKGSENDSLKIKQISVKPSNKKISCDGPLWDDFEKNGGRLKPNKVYGLTCSNLSDQSVLLTIYSDNGTLNFPIEPKNKDTCNVNKDIYDFAYGIPEDQDGIKSTDKKANKTFIWQQDVNALILLYEKVLDNCGKKGYEALDKAYFDLQEASHAAEKRFINFPPIDPWHRSFFKAFNDYLLRTKDNHKDYTNELYHERTCRFAQCP